MGFSGRVRVGVQLRDDVSNNVELRSRLCIVHCLKFNLHVRETLFCLLLFFFRYNVTIGVFTSSLCDCHVSSHLEEFLIVT